MYATNATYGIEINIGILQMMTADTDFFNR